MIHFKTSNNNKKKAKKKLLLTAENNVPTEAYSGAYKISKMEILPEIVNGWKLLTVFAKSFILDVWHDFEYISSQLTEYDK